MSDPVSGPPRALLFDLDGTLIDSAPGILASLAGALAGAGRTPRVPLDASLIGPPLRAMLRQVTGRDEPAIIEDLVARFQDDYDTRGYRYTRVYPGIDACLHDLAARGHRLFILTNKRRRPTLMILDLLGWTPLFADIQTLDTRNPPAPSKGALLGALLAEQHLDPGAACLIGDTPEDADAARANGVPFLGVAWGYGRFTPDHLGGAPLIADAATLAGLIPSPDAYSPPTTATTAAHSVASSASLMI